MLKRMWPYMSRYKKYLAISCFCVVAETVFELIIPIIMADIIDIGVANADKDYILIKGAQMIALSLIHIYSIVDIAKAKPGKRPDAKTLYDCVQVEREDVRPYVEYLLGRVVCCEAEETLRSYPVSITSDCMLYSGYAVSHMNPELYKVPFILSLIHICCIDYLSRTAGICRTLQSDECQYIGETA